MLKILLVGLYLIIAPFWEGFSLLIEKLLQDYRDVLDRRFSTFYDV